MQRYFHLWHVSEQISVNDIEKNEFLDCGSMYFTLNYLPMVCKLRCSKIRTSNSAGK